SMLRHREARNSRLPALLLFSVRTWEDFLFRDELLALHGERNGFELVMTVTREPARRVGDYARRVDAAMISEILARLPERSNQVFVCGSNPFVEAATQSLLEASVSADLIRTERYGR